jgi:hypothetical protein
MRNARWLAIPILCLGLISCAPVFNLFAGDNQGAKLRLQGDSNGATISFEAGNQEVQDGLSLESNPGNICKPTQDGIGCIAAKVASSEKLEIKVKGSKFSASATYYRPGSDRPFALLAETK